MSGLDDATEPAEQEAPADQQPGHSAYPAATAAAPDTSVGGVPATGAPTAAGTGESPSPPAAQPSVEAPSDPVPSPSDPAPAQAVGAVGESASEPSEPVGAVGESASEPSEPVAVADGAAGEPVADADPVTDVTGEHSAARAVEPSSQAPADAEGSAVDDGAGSATAESVPAESVPAETVTVPSTETESSAPPAPAIGDTKMPASPPSPTRAEPPPEVAAPAVAEADATTAPAAAKPAADGAGHSPAPDARTGNVPGAAASPATAAAGGRPGAGAAGPAGESGEGTPPPPSTAPPRPRPVTETGRIVEGLVTSVSSDSVELTLDDGRHAVIHRRNFGLHDEDPASVVSVGDRAFGAELVREDPKSRVVLSRAWALKRQAWEKVMNAAANNELLTGRVVSASKKGLVVDVGVRGFVPSSHLELEPVTNMSPYVDQSLELKILEVDPRKEKLVLSRRSLLLKAQRKEVQQLLSSLQKGEIRTGKVASLADYGAFVDLGGVSGLVHISELSWRRVAKPSEVVKVGDEVEVKVLDVKPKKKRISLSIRQITPDPLRSIEVGSILTGAVTRLVDFGAFVAIGEFEGLVHLSELAEFRVSTPEEIVAPGDEVGVKVLSVDVKRRRIELSIRRAAEYGG